MREFVTEILNSIQNNNSDTSIQYVLLVYVFDSL